MSCNFAKITPFLLLRMTADRVSFSQLEAVADDVVAPEAGNDEAGNVEADACVKVKGAAVGADTFEDAESSRTVVGPVETEAGENIAADVAPAEAMAGGTSSYQSATSSPGVVGADIFSPQSCLASLQARFNCRRARIAEESGVTDEPAAKAC